MSSIEFRPQRRSAFSASKIVGFVVVLAVVAAMAFSTKVVRIGSEQDVRADVFSPEAFGAENFAPIAAAIEAKAVDAATLGPEVMADKKAAGEKYGTASGVGPVIPVKFSGVAGEVKAGNYDVAVPGVPDGIRVRVQTGPAINGTELRDFPGTIAFGDFKNQIEFQNAGSGINNEMKKAVLAGVDTKTLGGKTIDVVGVFRLVNEKNWLVTPVKLSVQ